LSKSRGTVLVGVVLAILAAVHSVLGTWFSFPKGQPASLACGTDTPLDWATFFVGVGAAAGLGLLSLRAPGWSSGIAIVLGLTSVIGYGALWTVIATLRLELAPAAQSALGLVWPMISMVALVITGWGLQKRKAPVRWVVMLLVVLGLAVGGIGAYSAFRGMFC
jgi:hypothetical protein